MEKCWHSLPYELYAHIVTFLDPVTRRDLWANDKRLQGPQKLTGPSLDLKFDNLLLYPYPLSCLATYTSLKDEGRSIIELMWAPDSFSFTKSRRINFMTVNGITIWRDVEHSMSV